MVVSVAVNVNIVLTTALTGGNVITTEQFAKYSKICAANVVDATGAIRFNYKQLRTCLATHSEIGVEELFDKCLQFAGIVPQNSLERTTLLLLLLDIHMTYKLVTRELITRDESVMDLKSLFVDQLDGSDEPQSGSQTGGSDDTELF